MMRRIVILNIVLIGLLGLDRWLKSFALAGRTVDWPVGQFILVKNYGGVFSWPVSNGVAIGIMVLALIGLGWYSWRVWRRHDFFRLVGTMLMIVGAGSNLYDRFVHGFVVDWAYLGQWWPIFNIADVMIGVGVVMLLWPKLRHLTEK